MVEEGILRPCGRCLSGHRTAEPRNHGISETGFFVITMSGYLDLFDFKRLEDREKDKEKEKEKETRDAKKLRHGGVFPHMYVRTVERELKAYDKYFSVEGVNWNGHIYCLSDVPKCESNSDAVLKCRTGDRIHVTQGIMRLTSSIDVGCKASLRVLVFSCDRSNTAMTVGHILTHEALGTRFAPTAFYEMNSFHVYRDSLINISNVTSFPLPSFPAFDIKKDFTYSTHDNMCVMNNALFTLLISNKETSTLNIDVSFRLAFVDS